MARISTGTGDDGTTGLVGGARVRKSSALLAALGAIDEANDALGLAASHSTRGELRALLRSIQQDLFTVGADLMTPPGAANAMRVTRAHVDRLVREEDRLESELPPLKHFILPGGTPCAASLQLARSVARRAERELWRASEEQPVNQDALVYLNRLSDLLFLLAREENVKAAIEDTLWLGRAGRS